MNDDVCKIHVTTLFLLGDSPVCVECKLGVDMKFRKKPIVIEAIQWNGVNKNELDIFCKDIVLGPSHPDDNSFSVPTLEGSHLASVGDWIIKGIQGEFYHGKPDIFEKTYEKV